MSAGLHMPATVGALCRRFDAWRRTFRLVARNLKTAITSTQRSLKVPFLRAPPFGEGLNSFARVGYLLNCTFRRQDKREEMFIRFSVRLTLWTRTPLFGSLIILCFRYESNSKKGRNLVMFIGKPINNFMNKKVLSRALYRFGYS